MEDTLTVSVATDISGNLMDEDCAHCGEVIPQAHVRQTYFLQGDDGRLRIVSMHMGCMEEVLETYDGIDMNAIPDDQVGMIE